MATRISIKSPEEADRAIGQIGELQRQLEQVKLEADAKIKEILDEAILRRAEPTLLLQEYTNAVTRWAERNREELTNGGKTSTAKFLHGEIRWRTLPRTFIVENGAAVIKWLEEHGMKQFIRTIREVDKQALHSAPPAVVATIEGITVSQEERFSIVPAKTKVEA